MSLPDGLYTDVSLADYVASDRYGSSDLRRMRQGPPAMVRWAKENASGDTPSTIVGSAAHCLILTSDLFTETYAIRPEEYPDAKTGELKDWNGNSNWCKAWLEEHRAKGKTILTPDQARTVFAVEKAFTGKSAAFEALEGAHEREASVFWTCGVSGLLCKARPDWFDQEAVYDIKVSRHAENGSGLPFKAFTQGWMHQLAGNRAALRAAGIAVEKARLIVIAPAPPQALRVHLLEIKEEALDMLEAENERTRIDIKICEDAESWPGTPNDWTRIEPPASALIDMIGAVDFTGAEEVN